MPVCLFDLSVCLFDMPVCLFDLSVCLFDLSLCLFDLSVSLSYDLSFFIKSANFFCFLFYSVYNEKMFTTEIEDGREAP